MPPTRRRVSALAAVPIVAVALATSPALSSPGSAAADVTAPVIKTNAAAAFVVGGVIGDSAPDPDSWDQYTSMPERVKWTVDDDSGKVCHVEVYAMRKDSWPDVEYGRLVYAMHSASGSPAPLSQQVVDTFDDYDGGFGSSGDMHSGWKMIAEDCSGNTASVDVRSSGETAVLQEDNRSVGYDYGAVTGNLTYTGTWKTTACRCASWDAMRTTSAKGAGFTFTRVYERDDHVGLVMAKGPKRGRFAVYVDGVKTATVDTYATANTNRVIVYDKWMPAGTHTVRVVNLATKNRPRIDLDAVLSN